MSTDTKTAAETDTEPTDAPSVADASVPVEGELMVEDELLVEEVSIDGMCGVY